MHPNDILIKTFRTHKIVAASMAGVLVVYALIVEVLKLKEVRVDITVPAILDYLRFVFVFLAFAAYFIIRWVNRQLLVKKPTDSSEVLLAKLSRANLISLALCEVPALMGFILFLGSGNSRDFYLLMIISVILFYVFFPRYSYWVYWSKVID